MTRSLIDSDLRVKTLEPEFISGDECDRLFGTTPDIRKNLRTGGDWYAPVHHVWLNSRHCVYRVKMVRSWFHHRHQPHIHLAETEQFLSSFNQPKIAKTPPSRAAV
jgi:hypothetical protein